MEQAVRPTKWTLHELLPEPVEKALEDAFSKLEQAVVQFEAAQELLTDDISAKDFNIVIERLEAVSLLKSIVEAYADLAFAEDTQNTSVLNIRDQTGGH